MVLLILKIDKFCKNALLFMWLNYIDLQEIKFLKFLIGAKFFTLFSLLYLEAQSVL